MLGSCAMLEAPSSQGKLHRWGTISSPCLCGQTVLSIGDTPLRNVVSQTPAVAEEFGRQGATSPAVLRYATDTDLIQFRVTDFLARKRFLARASAFAGAFLSCLRKCVTPLSVQVLSLRDGSVQVKPLQREQGTQERQLQLSL